MPCPPFAFRRIGTVSRYVSGFAAIVARSIVSFSLAFTLALRRLGAFAGVVARFSAVETSFAFALTFHEVDLPVLLQHVAVQAPAFVVHWPACLIAGQR